MRRNSYPKNLTTEWTIFLFRFIMISLGSFYKIIYKTIYNRRNKIHSAKLLARVIKTDKFFKDGVIHFIYILLISLIANYLDK